MATLILRGDAEARAAVRLGLPLPRASRQRRRDNPTALLTELRRIAPATFRDPPVPLAIGIRQQITARLDSQFRPREVARALRHWCRQSTYQRALVTGAARIDLDGQIRGVVTEDEAVHAREQLDKIIRQARGEP